MNQENQTGSDSRWPVDIEGSSQIKRLHWTNGKLRVQFHSDACWEYDVVTEEQAIQLAEASSVGSHFAHQIKANHGARRISVENFTEEYENPAHDPDLDVDAEREAIADTPDDEGNATTENDEDSGDTAGNDEPVPE